MSFLSLTFLCFFILLLFPYYLVSHKLKLSVLLCSSALFYLGFGLNFFFLLFGLTLVTFAFSMFIPRLREIRFRKCAMSCVVLLTILPLLFFKYFDFISDSLSELCSHLGFNLGEHTLKLMAPVGISFYSFRVLSYLFDLYWGKITPERNFLKYALYVSYFPHILCGPIERAGSFFGRIDKNITFKSENLALGGKIIIFGLFKKLVIADPLSVYVNSVYSSPEHSSGLVLLLAAVFFSVQIYCDFSGYTDMANGLSRCLGFDLVENFRRPYFSRNVKEFWGRWHISLSTWLRDYIYIPLGGNRRSKPRKYLNIMATFGISGLWHGANWTFVAWGILHGFFLVLHDLLIGRKRSGSIGKDSCFLACCNTLLTFAAVTFAWILFRADSFSHFVEILSGILFRFDLSYSSISSLPLPFTGDNTSVAHFIVVVFYMALLFADSAIREFGVFQGLRKYDWIYYSFILASVFCFGYFGKSTFIYAQF